jgi:DNA primase
MEPVEEIKLKLDIVDAVAEYLQLKPAGSGSFKACCPFHQEKTPSFYVNRPRQSWHCFGCNIGGDVISFVQKMEGMDFPEVLAFLAQKVGVILPTYNMQASSEKKRLHEVNDLAARFFRAELLQSPEAEHARAYAAKRGLDDLTGDVWRIGYSPTGWSGLSDTLKQKGVTDDELIRAGLAIKSDRGGVFDRFRDRLMFTICDVHGTVVGFTGRLLNADAKEAKYVNTPETSAYKKSLVLYGLDKAKGDIKRKDLAVIVEGNMDVVTSHQYNVTNVVASSGTALTGEQLNLIKRFSSNLAIAFDADAAGNAATIRGLDLARSQDFNVRVITLPPDAGKDPDDAIRKDVEIWKTAINDALPVIEWLYRNAFRSHDQSKPEEKKKVAAAILPEFRRITNAIERDAWITRLSRDLGVSEDALREELRKSTDPLSSPFARGRQSQNEIKKSSPYEGEAGGVKKKPDDQEESLDQRLLAILYVRPELEGLAQERMGEYYQSRSPSNDLLNLLAIFADREFPDQTLETLRRELDFTAQRLREIRVTARRKILEQQMREAEIAGDDAKIRDLLAQFTRLAR